MAVVKTRLVIGFSIAACALALIALDVVMDSAAFMTAMVGLCTAVAMYEFYVMVEHKKVKTFAGIGILAALLLIFGEYLLNNQRLLGKWEYANMTLLLLFLVVFGLFLARMMHGEVKDSLFSLAVTVFGIFYIWGLASFILRLRFLHLDLGGGETVDVGVFLIVLLIAVSKLNDSFAFFAGRFLGRNKLAPKISPGKTVEGLFGGLAGGTLGAVAVYMIFPEAAYFSVEFYVVFAVLVGLSSHLGDLSESMLKRDVGVKDSAALFPEAGGFLDLIDGLLFASPVAYFITVFMCRTHFASLTEIGMSSQR